MLMDAGYWILDTGCWMLDSHKYTNGVFQQFPLSGNMTVGLKA
jgi:hypothetical protein